MQLIISLRPWVPSLFTARRLLLLLLLLLLLWHFHMGLENLKDNNLSLQPDWNKDIVPAGWVAAERAVTTTIIYSQKFKATSLSFMHNGISNSWQSRVRQGCALPTLFPDRAPWRKRSWGSDFLSLYVCTHTLSLKPTRIRPHKSCCGHIPGQQPPNYILFPGSCGRAGDILCLVSQKLFNTISSRHKNLSPPSLPTLKAFSTRTPKSSLRRIQPPIWSIFETKSSWSWSLWLFLEYWTTEYPWALKYLSRRLIWLEGCDNRLKNPKYKPKMYNMTVRYYT